MVHSSFNFRRILARQDSEPAVVQGLVPLCSQQYERMFNTTRIPGETADALTHFADSTHIVVMSGGKFYRVGCYKENRLLEPAEIQR